MAAAAAAAVAIGGSRVSAPAPASACQPTCHAQEAWLDKMPGKHRMILDATTASGADLAIVLCLSHSVTVFAFTDAIWSKHGKAFRRRRHVHVAHRRNAGRQPVQRRGHDPEQRRLVFRRQ